MSLNLPIYLNLEYLNDQKKGISDQNALLCHVEHDDYGNRKCAIPLKINADGHIVLDLKNVISFEID
jgi:hypothetical protein